MPSIIDDIVQTRQLNEILENNKISNYENSIGLNFSIEEQLLSYIYPEFQNIDIILKVHELKNIFYGNLSKDMFSKANAYNILHLTNYRMNEDFILNQVEYTFEELFKYAEKHNINVDDKRNELYSVLEKVELSLKNANIGLKSLRRLAEYVQYASKPLYNENFEEASIFINLGKKIFEDPKSKILELDFSSERLFLLGSKHLSNFLSLTSIRNSIVAELRNKNIVSQAESYVNNQKTLSDLQKIIFEKSIEKKIDLTSSQKISSFILFKDGSICFKEGVSDYKYEDTHDANKIVIQKLQESSIDYLLRKKPKMSKLFREKYEEDKDSIVSILNTIGRYLENEQNVKSYLKDGYEEFLKDLMNNKSVEAFDDAFSKIAAEHKFKQFAYSIVSNKYKDLYDNETLELLREIYNEKTGIEQLQNFIGKKIAAFKNPEDFNSNLRQYISKINGFDEDKIIEKVKDLGGTIVSNENNVLIVETTNYEQMKDLGSTSWCIVRDESYYESYTNNGNRQYIVFNFNKLSRDNESMIGITLKQDGTFRTSHVKNDNSISENQVINFTDTILIKQKMTYPNMNPRLVEKLFPVLNKKTKKAIGF